MDIYDSLGFGLLLITLKNLRANGTFLVQTRCHTKQAAWNN